MAANNTLRGEQKAVFLSRRSEKRGKEIEIKDFNLAEENNFPCKLR